MLALHRAGLLKAAAHITGGGLPGNLPRVLPEDTVAVLEPYLVVPPVFGWLARTGGVAAGEMLRVFNCGIGMALVVGRRRGGDGVAAGSRRKRRAHRPHRGRQRPADGADRSARRLAEVEAARPPS